MFAVSSCADDQAPTRSDVPGHAEMATDSADGAVVQLHGDEKRAAENLERAYLRAEFLTSGTDTEARCFATTLVDRLGLRSMRWYRMVREDLSARVGFRGYLDPNDAEAYAGALVQCLDYKDIVEDMVAPNDSPMSDSYVRSGDS
jgi:hypothetical protein